MGVYYPQAACILEILWEDWSTNKLDLTKTHLLVVQPKDITVEINNHKEADTCRFTIDYKNFPFEPRAIRQMKVTVAMKNMEKLVDPSGKFVQIAPINELTLSTEGRAQFSKQLLEAVVFAGFADESEIMLDDARREVVIECRDQTSLLIDRKQARTSITLDRPIKTIIRQILDQSDSTKPIQIEFRPADLESTVQNIAQVSADITDAKKQTKSNETAWDVINDLCERVALVPFIELDKLVITKPRILFAKSRRRVLTWGINLKSLSMKRKMGRDKGINVEVRSLDIKNKKVVKAEYPFDVTGQRQTINKIVNGETKSEPAPKHVFFMPDIIDSNILLDRAQDIWHEMARQELEGSLATKEMILCDKDGTEFSVLRFKMGAPLEIVVEPEDMKALGSLQGKGLEAMRQALVQRCYDPSVALALAKSFQEMRSKVPPFYTKRVQLTLSRGQAFEAKIDFINFIELDPSVLYPKAERKKAEAEAPPPPNSLAGLLSEGRLPPKGVS